MVHTQSPTLIPLFFRFNNGIRVRETGGIALATKGAEKNNGFVSNNLDLMCCYSNVEITPSQTLLQLLNHADNCLLVLSNFSLSVTK